MPEIQHATLWVKYFNLSLSLAVLTQDLRLVLD